MILFCLRSYFMVLVISLMNSLLPMFVFLRLVFVTILEFRIISFSWFFARQNVFWAVRLGYGPIFGEHVLISKMVILASLVDVTLNCFICFGFTHLIGFFSRLGFSFSSFVFFVGKEVVYLIVIFKQVFQLRFALFMSFFTSIVCKY